MLHNAPSLDLSSIILFWKKSRKIDHVSWIDTESICNWILPGYPGGVIVIFFDFYSNFGFFFQLTLAILIWFFSISTKIY